MKRVLITGADGFFGSHLTEAMVRILSMKRLPSAARELFWLLRRDRSWLFAMGSMSAGAFDFVSAALARRIAAPAFRGRA